MRTRHSARCLGPRARGVPPPGRRSTGRANPRCHRRRRESSARHEADPDHGARGLAVPAAVSRPAHARTYQHRFGAERPGDPQGEGEREHGEREVAEAGHAQVARAEEQRHEVGAAGEELVHDPDRESPKERGLQLHRRKPNDSNDPPTTTTSAAWSAVARASLPMDPTSTLTHRPPPRLEPARSSVRRSLTRRTPGFARHPTETGGPARPNPVPRPPPTMRRRPRDR